MTEQTPRQPFRVEFNDQFPEPQDLQDAIGRKETLLLEIQSIQDQLGEHKEPSGPNPPEDFAFWRRRARRALNIKNGQHRMLKQWIKARQAETDARPLVQVLDLISSWMEQYEIEPTPPERDLLNTAAAQAGTEMVYA